MWSFDEDQCDTVVACSTGNCDLGTCGSCYINMTDEPEEKREALDAELSDVIGDFDSSASKVASSPESHVGDDEDERIPKSTLILDELAQIRKIIEGQLSCDQRKDEAFERLYQELDAVKRNKVFEDYRPLFIDLILLYDRLQAAKADSESIGIDVLESLQSELKEILSRREIKSMENAPDVFDPVTQRAVSIESVQSVEHDGKVIRVLREGFAYKGTVLRPQEVVVGRYQLSTTNSESGKKSLCQNQKRKKK